MSRRTVRRPRALSAALLLLVGCVSQATDETRPVTAEVDRGPLVFEGSYHGELQAKESVDIHAPEMANVYYLTVDTVLDDGTPVHEGDVVLRFVSGPIEDDLRDRRSELAVAEAEMRRVQQTLAKERIDLELEVQRQQKGLERAKLAVVEGVNLISKLELEKAKLDVRKAELELRLAREALGAFGGKREAGLEVQDLKAQAAREKVVESEKMVAALDVKAPGSGVVYGPYVRLNWVRSKVAPGKVVRPGDKLLELPDLSTFVANLYVRQRDGTFLNPGDAATVYPTVKPDRAIVGKVLEREDFATTRNERLGTDTAEGNLKEVLVKVELAETLPELRPGGTVRADIASTLVEDAVRVPLAALRATDGGYVATLADGATRTVKIGRTTPTYAEVLDGLEPGDQVVLQ